jgi:hypothetical protein
MRSHARPIATRPLSTSPTLRIDEHRPPRAGRRRPARTSVASVQRDGRDEHTPDVGAL